MIKTRTLRFTAFMIAVISIIALLSAPYVLAKSKARLSAKKLTITVGKSRTLKLSGTSKKAKWSSTKKIVSITKKGRKKHTAVIRAKKAGTCYVKVRFGKKTLKCKVTVKARKKPVKPEPEFQEKPLSGSSEDLTESITRGSVTGREADSTFIRAMTGTSLKMLKYLCASAEDKNGNILISPDSILTAMAMTENGAANETLADMEKAFGNIPVDDFNAYLYTLNERLTSLDCVSYHIADSIWFKQNEISVNNEFLQKNADYFKAQIFSAPFSQETINDINNWVYNNTHGMIPDIISDFNTDTVMVLLNAIAFEGEWAEKYHDAQIKSSQKFYNEDGTVQKKVTMLSGIENSYVKVNGAEGFIKPYIGGKIAFMGLEIPEGKTVDEFIQTLDEDDLIDGYAARTNSYYVHTKMPEFKYDYDTSLVDTLIDLGIKNAFSDELADFSGMTPPEQPVKISDVIHKTHIELTRDGTKAAAATAVIVDKASSVIPDEKEDRYVDLDHPFVYAIIDTETGIPLFIGTVKTV